MLALTAQLKAESQWLELRAMSDEVAAVLSGDDLACAYLRISGAWESSAVNADDYRQSLRYARKAYECSTVGGLMHTWAAGRVGNLLTEFGRAVEAEWYISQYLKCVEANPAAKVLLSWVLFNRARSLCFRTRYSHAMPYLEQALVLSQDNDLSERIQLTMTWVYAEMGRLRMAASVLPDSVSENNSGLLLAAHACIAASRKDWQLAETTAKNALECISSVAWRDAIQVAELYLILRVAARKLGRIGQAACCQLKITTTLSCWDVSIAFHLLLYLTRRGGEIDAETSHRFGAGNHRCGLTGTVG